MQFTLYAYLSKHPVQMKAVQYWLKLNLPVPSAVQRQLANELHAEMIIRLMDILVKEGDLSMDKALQVHFEIGKEIAEQVKDFLSVNPDDAASLSGIIDFLHGLLFISGKKSLKIRRIKQFLIGENVLYPTSWLTCMKEAAPITVISFRKCIKEFCLASIQKQEQMIWKQPGHRVLSTANCRPGLNRISMSSNQGNNWYADLMSSKNDDQG